MLLRFHSPWNKINAITTPLKASGMLKSTDNGALHPLKIEEVISNTKRIENATATDISKIICFTCSVIPPNEYVTSLGSFMLLRALSAWLDTLLISFDVICAVTRENG